MSVFVLRTQFSLGEELGRSPLGFSLMTCRFPWAPEVWLLGWEQGPLPYQALVVLRSCAGNVVPWGLPPGASLPAGGLVAQGLLLHQISQLCPWGCWAGSGELTLHVQDPCTGRSPASWGKPHGAGGQL